MKREKVIPQEFDKVTIGALAEAFGKSFLTIERWIEGEDDRLTSEKAKEVYSKYQPTLIGLSFAKV